LATVDFRDVEQATRGHRATRSSWWQEFVGQAKKVTTLAKTEEKQAFKPLAIGEADEFVKRNRRHLRTILEALGPGWLSDRVMYWSKQREEVNYEGKLISEQQQAAVERLRLYAASGLCGTTDGLPI
jgi:hypothetical protein